MNFFHQLKSYFSSPTTLTKPLSKWDWSIVFDGTKSPVKTILFILICVTWIVPGLIGHEPWKGDEAATFGVIYQMLKSGQWLIPTLAGEPFVERPPLYYITGVIFVKAFSFLLPIHDAARLASGFFNCITVLFTALSGRALMGERFGRITVIILLGTLGLILRVHEMISDTALLAGFTMGFYGLAISKEKPSLAAICFGLGTTIGFLSRGFVGPIMLLSIAIALPLFSKSWRSINYGKFLLLGLIIAIPLCLIWPLALRNESPQLFHEWLYGNNIDELKVHFRDDPLEGPLYYLRIIPWYTWPALPMGLWTLWINRSEGFKNPAIQLPLISVCILFLILFIGPNIKEVNTLPTLIPLALLASGGIDRLRRGAASALDSFGMMTFGFLSLMLWLGWIALRLNTPEKFIMWVDRYQPNFSMPLHVPSLIVAFILSIIYVTILVHAKRSPRRAVINWTTGISLFWMLGMTLWLPMIDESRSYRSTMEALRSAIPQNVNCVASSNLGEAQRALLYYYTDITTKRIESGDGTNCRLLILQTGAGKKEPISKPWKKIWEGSRPGDTAESLTVYYRRR